MMLLVLHKAGEVAKYEMPNIVGPIPGFQMFRVDRSTRCGGVVLYVSEPIDAVQPDINQSINQSVNF